MSVAPVISAIVLCPDVERSASVDRSLLGLTVGERLLMTLSMGGVRRVAFAGPGPRPELGEPAPDLEFTDLANLGVLDDIGDRAPPGDHAHPDARSAATGAWVVTSDAVFDRNLLAHPPRPDTDRHAPLQYASAERVRELLADPDAFLSQLDADRPITGSGYAIRVTDHRSARRARRALLLSLRKPIDGIVSRHLNRYISTFLSSLLAPTGVRPNALTIAFMVLGVSAGVFAAFAENWWCLVCAGALFQAQSILDGCDGEIARLTYRFSRSGQWLDSIGDDLTNYAFCLGLAIGQARVLDRPELYIAGAVTLAAQLAMAFLLYRRMILLGTGDLLAIPDTVSGGDTRFARILSMGRTLAKRDTFVLVIAALTAVQLPLWAFFVFAAGTYPMLVGVVINERRLARLDAPDEVGRE